MLGTATGGLIREDIARILERYEKFLDATNRSEDELVALFRDADSGRKFAASTPSVGDAVAALLRKMGETNELYRYLIV